VATDAPENRADVPTSVLQQADRPQSVPAAGPEMEPPMLQGPRFGVRVTQAALPVAVALAVLLGIWQWYASQPTIDPQLLPTPLAVWNALVAQRDPLWRNTMVTLSETVAGFGASLAAGVLLATVIDFSPWLRRAIYPLLVATQTIPIITLAPLLVLWFGFGLTSKAIVVTLVCFFPIVVALADGLRGADPELIKLFRSFGAGRWRIYWSVRLPGALPSLFSGVRIAITYAVIGAIFGEYVGAESGLAVYMKLHQAATAAVMAAIVVTAALSIALFALTALVERLVLPWYYAQGRGT
jgi:ABC-type nitrate/sulfonate/bicarbonate transport system permease component